MPHATDNQSVVLVRSLFRTLDSMDAAGFSDFLTDDARFRFGNADFVTGRANIRNSVANFFGSIAHLSHDVQRIWVNADAIACDGTVTYGRHDGSEITLPFADVLGMRDEKIVEYLIYIDIAPLFA